MDKLAALEIGNRATKAVLGVQHQLIAATLAVILTDMFRNLRNPEELVQETLRRAWRPIKQVYQKNAQPDACIPFLFLEGQSLANERHLLAIQKEAQEAEVQIAAHREAKTREEQRLLQEELEAARLGEAPADPLPAKKVTKKPAKQVEAK